MSLPSDTPATPPTTPVPGSPEHDAAMAAKFEGAAPKPVAQPDPAPARPAWLPEKFKSPEDMAKAYSELEKKLGQPPAPQPQGAPPATPEGQPPSGEQPPAPEASVDFQAVADEYIEKGELSEATYAVLQKSGISKAVADQFIAGQKAAAAVREQALYSEVGGEENYKKLLQWGATNFTAEDVEAFNAGIAGSQAAAKMAVAGLKLRYEASLGKPPTLLGGTQGGPSAGYESQAQMKADMKDPRYKSDPAFRAKVEAKLAQTTAF